MRNLIYTVSTATYYPLLHICVDSIRRFSDVDICCITPASEKPFRTKAKNVFLLPSENFDARYTSKFTINQWDAAKDYDNFLYLDSDQVCIKNPDVVFDCIANSPNKVCAGVEHHDLNRSWFAHKFTDKTFKEKQEAYNAGIFGFNRNLAGAFEELLQFIEENWQYCLFDQPLFNEFFIEKDLLNPSLSPYIYYDCDCMHHTATNNTKDVNEVVFIHAMGGFGKIDEKFNKMKFNYMSSNKQNVLPK